MSEEQTPFAATPAPSPEAATVIADPQPVAQPTPIVIPDAVQHLVGEGKKYATLDLALAALEPAQLHIDKIQAENAELRASNEKARAQEDILADWKAQISEQTPVPSPQVVSSPTQTPEAIGMMVNQQMEAIAAKAAAKANTEEVTAAMTQHYGDAAKAEAAYIAQAAEMGLGVAGMNTLSAQSPKAVLKMLGITKQSSPAPTPSHGSVNTATLNPTSTPVARKSVMAGASHAEQKAAWKSFAPQT